MSNEEAHNIYNMVGLRTGCCQITELVEKYEQLQQENNELKKKFLEAVDNYEQVNFKNIQAIEYIKENDYWFDGDDLQIGLLENEVNELLEILKGDK